MAKVHICSICGSDRHYETFCNYKKRKPISQRGKRSEIYEGWKKTVAIPYLDKKTGRVCAACGGARCGNRQLDVEHKLGRGSHPQLKMDVKNVQYMGRDPCHIEKTGTLRWSKSES